MTYSVKRKKKIPLKKRYYIAGHIKEDLKPLEKKYNISFTSVRYTKKGKRIK